MGENYASLPIAPSPLPLLCLCLYGTRPKGRVALRGTRPKGRAPSFKDSGASLGPWSQKEEGALSLLGARELDSKEAIFQITLLKYLIRK